MGEEAKDIRGYRIYRSELENQGPWTFVTEFSIADATAGILPQFVNYDPSGVYRTNTSTAFPDAIPLRQNKYVSGLSPEGGDDIQGLYAFTDHSSKPGFPVGIRCGPTTLGTAIGMKRAWPYPLLKVTLVHPGVPLRVVLQVLYPSWVVPLFLTD